MLKPLFNGMALGALISLSFRLEAPAQGVQREAKNFNLRPAASQPFPDCLLDQGALLGRATDLPCRQDRCARYPQLVDFLKFAGVAPLLDPDRAAVRATPRVAGPALGLCAYRARVLSSAGLSEGRRWKFCFA
jgi:hypothetical protein